MAPAVAMQRLLGNAGFGFVHRGAHAHSVSLAGQAWLALREQPPQILRQLNVGRSPVRPFDRILSDIGLVIGCTRGNKGAESEHANLDHLERHRDGIVRPQWGGHHAVA